jgi:hypothetical protein
MILEDHIHKSFKVINSILLLMTDKHKLVLKDLTDSNYKLDKRHADLFKSLEKTREQNRKDDFKSWLNSKTQNGVKVSDILNKMLRDMIKVLKNDGYVIKDEKAFRDYMASYIYREC